MPSARCTRSYPRPDHAPGTPNRRQSALHWCRQLVDWGCSRSGAGLDVLSQEPADPADPLLKLENVIVTPHASFYSETSLEELALGGAEHAAQVLRGELPTDIINPQVMAQANYRFGAFQKGL